jgi:hypothetical protein
MDSKLFLVIATLLVLMVVLIYKSGKTYPILILFAITYFIQYIVAPYFFYFHYPVGLKAMAVNSTTYFSYAIPALIFLFAGVYLFSTRRPQYIDFKSIDPVQASRYGWFLVILSFFFDVVAFLQIPFLLPLVSFTIYLKYVGCFCLVFTRSKVAILAIIIIYARLMVSVLAMGVFVDFFIWSAYLFLFVVLSYKFSFIVRLNTFLLIIPVITTVQGVKKEYRDVVWTEKESGSLELLLELSQTQRAETDPEESYFQSSSFLRTIGRLNQGWHLSMTLNHVPRYQPTVNGSELFTDITASLVPRFLAAGKKKVNDKEKFEKYTGHHIYGNTAMSIGVLGDFYINFGYWGSFIALFFLGVFVALVLKYFMRRYVYVNPLYLVWIPFLFSYLIRANNEFYIFFNNLVKGLILFLLLDYIFRRFLTNTRKANNR